MAKFLYQTIESLEQAGFLKDMPEFIEQGLSNRIVLRDYQEKAFRYFISYFGNENLRKNKQIHNLFHMATGSGKQLSWLASFYISTQRVIVNFSFSSIRRTS